ncbi:YeeE/YedE family protein, partial [Streptomyces sp. RKCA-744]|nr:YeeE/YedE family protein [Streptomyces sp. RKCA744]
MTTAPPAEAAKTAALLSPSPTSAPRPTAPAAPPVRRVPLVVSGLLG